MKPTFVMFALLAATAVGAPAVAQDTTRAGTIAGTVSDQGGGGLAGAQVFIGDTPGTARGAVTGANGQYTLAIPAGTHTLRVRRIGYRPQEASITVGAGERVTQDFQMVRDPLSLATVLVTGTTTPRVSLESSVAATTLTNEIINEAAPRSTTEMLRYVPGFTRVESSGGEVNQNISMRGILGVEYVMFMEDGLPVFPTMHTFFMNADNLFRPDENIDRMEVVRGGASALFGSNTPGAIVNFINRTGGAELAGTMRVTAATEGLARYDFNVNGPLAEDWRFNVGGFYRYDYGVRDPGFPGIRGGQIKANVTRLLDNGYIRASFKYINDRNQFILPLPFQDPDDPDYVPGFSDYGSMSTNEGNHLRVPTPDGELELPLGDGLRTQAGWLTADAQFDLGNDWSIRNTAQVMSNDQGWNAILPFDVMPADEFVSRPTNANGLGLPAGTPFQFLFTNHRDAQGDRIPFDTENGLVAPGGQWHVEKPLTAFQNQLQVSKAFGRNNVAFGLYFANYTQENRWFFTDILMDVRDNPRFLDLVVGTGPDANNVTSNGFRRFVSNYVNGDGQTTVVSGVIGAGIQATDRLRVDIGARLEYNDFVQSSENTSTVDLDEDPSTTFNNVVWGNGTFRHFSRSIDDWAASLGLNYSLNERMAIYAQASRAYKMPALDEFLNATAVEQIELFDSRETQTLEGGVKYSSPRLGFTVNGFYALLKNIVGQGAVVGEDGSTTWIITTSPENKSYGVEFEVAGQPTEMLNVIATGTVLKAELGSGAGADIGSWINGVPPVIGNLSATYDLDQFRFLGDWHYVGRRFADFANDVELEAYNYFNFGASYRFATQPITVSADLLNAFQSKGLEEGNPRLTLIGGSTSDLFLARPLLPRRFRVSFTYDF
jgi:outer membrane receptor protein involved in Fe transport